MPTEALINRKINAQFLSLDKLVAWECGMVLNQVVARRTPTGWQVMVKASSRRKDFISYVSAGTFGDTISLLGEIADRGGLTWQEDRYAPKYKERP